MIFLEKGDGNKAGYRLQRFPIRIIFVLSEAGQKEVLWGIDNVVRKVTFLPKPLLFPSLNL